LSIPAGCLIQRIFIKAVGQVFSKTQTLTGGTSSVDWNNGNAISTDYDCSAGMSFVSLRDGGTYTLIITEVGTTACSLVPPLPVLMRELFLTGLNRPTE